jgi:pilus assembly protein Flp/PilA
MTALRRENVEMRTHLRNRLNGDDGATMVEYALMVALIALVCFAAVQFVGGNTSNSYSRFNTSLTAAS